MAKDRRPVFEWTDGAPENEKEQRIELYRTPKDGGILRMIVLSQKIVGHNTHWSGWRSVPCRPPNCPCLDNRGCHQVPTWHGWLAAMAIGDQRIDAKRRVMDREIFLWEMTLPAAARFKRPLLELGTLRGLEIRAKRRDKTDNGIITLTIVTITPAPELPAAPDVMKTMMRIWHISGEPEERSPGNMRLSEAEQAQLEAAHGLVREAHPHRTLGDERTRRLRPDDNVRLDKKKNRGVSQITPARTTDLNSIDPEEPLPTIGNVLASAFKRRQAALGESSEGGETSGDGMQPVHGVLRAPKLETGGNGHATNGNQT